MTRKTLQRPFYQNPACDNPPSLQQWKEMLAISTRINSKLQKDDLPILQYYLRYHDDRCFDLLALVPKDVFFDYVDDAKQKILNQEIRQIGYKKDYRVALIVLPLIDNLQALNLDKEGYVLVFDTLPAVA